VTILRGDWEAILGHHLLRPLWQCTRSRWRDLNSDLDYHVVDVAHTDTIGKYQNVPQIHQDDGLALCMFSGFIFIKYIMS